MRLMKAILACVLPAWAAKLPRSDEVKAVLVNLQTGSAGSSCPENQFPVVNLTVEGIGYHEDVLPGAQTQKLQEHLAGHPDWSIGKPWVLSLTAESSDIKDREFGFAGGEGFMVFKVPRAGRKNIVVTGSVESLAEHTRLEYRGNEVITAPGAIIFTNVCLRPMTCEHFLTQNPSMCKDGLWSPKPHPEKVTGHTRNTCCQKIRCEDAAPCVPQTKYDKRPDYSKTFGSKPDQCCLPKLCTGSVCNSSGWEPKPGFHILGSTLSECCTPRDCDDYTCSARSVKKPKRYDVQGQAILQQGSTDEECCDPISCSHVKCDATDEWARNRSATVGSSLEDCCIPLYCAKHTCEPASQWEKNPHAILGSSNPSCCKPKLCKDFKCEEGFALRAGAVFGQKQLRGSSSEECCEKKLCKNWKCSDPSKWIQKADETSQDIARHGWSDEAQKLGQDTFAEEPQEKKVSEYAKWMEQGETSTATPPNQVCSGTVCVSRKLVPRREVKQIHVRSGALIDFIEFAFTTGEPLKIGEGKGDEQEPFTLEPGEVITEIHGGQGALLDRVQFVTSLGRTSSAYGGTGGENFTFKVTEGKMITGLDRAVGLAGKITNIHESLSRPLTEAEKAYDEATLNLEAARRSLDAKEVELGKLRLKIEDSTGTHAAYKALQKCGESTVGEYSYKICPFEDAKQGHVSLGRWKGWAMDNPHTGLFEGGERCFSGIVRSLRVTFECGEDYAIESVKEPSQCVYEATMTHPAACDPKAFEIGEDRVLGPHEAHVEL